MQKRVAYFVNSVIAIGYYSTKIKNYTLLLSHVPHYTTGLKHSQCYFGFMICPVFTTSNAEPGTFFNVFSWSKSQFGLASPPMVQDSPLSATINPYFFIA